MIALEKRYEIPRHGPLDYRAVYLDEMRAGLRRARRGRLAGRRSEILAGLEYARRFGALIARVDARKAAAR